jgi:hypothetical protein
MSACSELTAKPEKLSEAQTCENLKGLIADHPNQFSHYKKIFQLIGASTFGLQKKCFPMPIIARYGNGARGYLTMFANRKQAAIKTRPLATTRRMQALFKIAWVKHGLLKPTPPKVAESTGYIAPWISPPLFQYATLKINVAGQNPGKTPSLSAIKTI